MLGLIKFLLLFTMNIRTDSTDTAYPQLIDRCDAFVHSGSKVKSFVNRFDRNEIKKSETTTKKSLSNRGSNSSLNKQKCDECKKYEATIESLKSQIDLLKEKNDCLETENKELKEFRNRNINNGIKRIWRSMRRRGN